MDGTFSTIFAKRYVRKLLKSTLFLTKTPLKCLWKSLKTKKSLPAYVWWHRNRLTHRIITPFNSADTLGPKQVSRSNQRHQKTYRKFFRAFKNQIYHFLKSIFGCPTCDFSQLLMKIVEKSKKFITHGRLRAPKSFEASYDHAKHLVG